jgi:AraC-like DNA-binding protein
MDYAAGLLRDDRLSVIQVANEVGYSNASHFARAFKDRHQLLPKAYQCLHRLSAE